MIYTGIIVYIKIKRNYCNILYNKFSFLNSDNKKYSQVIICLEEDAEIYLTEH
jgi:hypothetical protein